MQPNPPQPSIDPYAPPKSALDGTNNTTYLEQDGYAFQNELIANQHFKSPLICAKLGIAIRSETTPTPKKITIKRIPGPHTKTFNIFSILAILSLFIWFAYTSNLHNIIPAILIFAIASSPINRLTTKPYQIPLYFSEQYTHIHKRRIIIFTSILVILITIFTIGIITKNLEHITFSTLAAFITLIVFKFKMTKFIVTQTKGEFHYIRGIHKGLLNALPHLPLTSTPPSYNPEHPNPMFTSPITLNHTSEKKPQ